VCDACGDKFEPKEGTNLVNIPKCVKRVLNEFPNVTLEKLPNELTMQSG
jgi:hypothetical protein